MVRQGLSRIRKTPPTDGQPGANGAQSRWKSTACRSRCPRARPSCALRHCAERDIPKLCATDTLKAFGSCRVCLVEIEGRKGFPASCTTEVAAGMKVRTHSEALTRLRRSVLELYVSEHPMGSCPDASRCELETLAHRTRHRAVALRRSGNRARRAHAEARRRQQSVFPIRQRPVHRLFALRARLRGQAGHVCADHRRPRARLAGRRFAAPAVPRVRVRFLRRLRRSLSHGRACWRSR